jgi:hypothetical protein
VSATTGRRGSSTADEFPPFEWLVSDVPGIVAGLASTGSISTATAVAADRLIRMGKHDRALTLALDEATRVAGR